LSPADVAASVRARLLAAAKARGEEFERTLSRFATERLLFRLGESDARDRCVLKGAGLLTVWLRDPYRATRDVDFLAMGPDDDDAIRGIIQTICAVPCPEDGLQFDLTDLKLQPIHENVEYSGKRAQFIARLEAARIKVQIDLVFGDAVSGGPESIQYPTMLNDLPAPHVQVYPRVVSVAEKFEAMVKLGITNSRMKDFHDVWALSDAFEFDGSVLRAAVLACFDRRRTESSSEIPSALTPAFYDNPDMQVRWSAYLRSGSVLITPPARFGMIGERIIQFLAPVRDSIVAGETFQVGWSPGGPWE
jgi:predicted nucleotidyltransferase component of viral defense system